MSTMNIDPPRRRRRVRSALHDAPQGPSAQRRLSARCPIIGDLDVMTSMRVVALFLGAGLAGGCATGNRASLHREVRQAGEARPRSGRAPSRRRHLASGAHEDDPASVGQAGHEGECRRQGGICRSAARGGAAARSGVSVGRESSARRARVSAARDSRHGVHLREPRACCRSRGSPRRTRCWRGSGGTGDSPGSGSDRHRARPTSIHLPRRRRTRSARCSTRSASLPRHGGRSHALWRSTRAPGGR